MLGFLIEFKQMVALSNKTQTMLSLKKKIKFNAVMYLNSIVKPNCI